MNRAPTSLMAGICFHPCRPLVRNADQPVDVFFGSNRTQPLDSVA